MERILILFFVCFAISTQPKDQVEVKALISEVNDEMKIEANFRNLLDSITKNDIKKMDTFRSSLEQQVVRGEQAFEQVKEELQFARQKNSYNRKNSNNQNDDTTEKAMVFKRAVRANYGRPDVLKTEIPSPSIDHLVVLRKYFGHTQFRTTQWRVIHSILEEKRDNCLIMATGKGKSLCYQFPAVYQPNGLSIVVSPLISLMRDQVIGLQKSNISAVFLGSAQKDTERSLLDVYAGFCRVLYVTPEWCTSPTGEEILEKIASMRQVTVVAIDEAHCVSYWGHDFRPAYRKLKGLRKILPEVPILALTASATPMIKSDIIKSLDLSYPTVTVTSFNRPNLYMAVFSKISSSDPEQVFLNLRPAMEMKGSGYVFPGPTIIYCASRKRTKAVADVLKGYNIKCGVYHAGLTLRQRNEVHEKFLADELDVVVATVAFGMGIDKPNVRCVIHYGLPKDVESYYQEIGRAGRDGLPAKCYVFHSYDDAILNEIIIANSSNEKYLLHKRQMMRRMKDFIETKNCRRHLLLSYFNEPLSYQPNEPQPNCCDNCDRRQNRISNPNTERRPHIDLSEEIQRLLRVFCFFRGRFGLLVPIKFLRGAKDSRFTKNQMATELYGAGKGYSEAAWKALAQFCVEENLLQEKDSYTRKNVGNESTLKLFFASTIEVSEKGRAFLFSYGKRKYHFGIPEQTEKLFEVNDKHCGRRKTRPMVSMKKLPDIHG